MQHLHVSAAFIPRLFRSRWGKEAVSRQDLEAILQGEGKKAEGKRKKKKTKFTDRQYATRKVKGTEGKTNQGGFRQEKGEGLLRKKRKFGSTLTAISKPEPAVCY